MLRNFPQGGSMGIDGMGNFGQLTAYQKMQMRQKMTFGSVTSNYQTRNLNFNANTSIFKQNSNIFMASKQARMNQMYGFDAIARLNQQQAANQTNGTQNANETQQENSKSWKELASEAKSAIKAFDEVFGKKKSGGAGSAKADKAINDIKNAKDKTGLQKSISGAQSELTNVQASLQKSTSSLTEAKAKETQTAQTAQQTEEKLTQSKQDLTSNEQKLTEAQSNVKDCKQALKNAKSQATKDNPNTAAIEQAEANLKQAEAAEKQAKQAVEQSKEQVKTDEKANTTAKKEAESAKAESSKLQSQVDTLQKQSTDLQSAITDGNSRLETIGKEDTKTDKTDNAEKTDQSGQEVKKKSSSQMPSDNVDLSNVPEGKEEQLAWINEKLSEITANYEKNGGDAPLYDDPVYITLMMQKDNLEGTDRTSEFLKEDQATWIDNQMSEIAAEYANGKGDSSLEEDPIYSALKEQKSRLEGTAVPDGTVDPALAAKNQKIDNAEDSVILSKSGNKIATDMKPAGTAPNNKSTLKSEDTDVDKNTAKARGFSENSSTTIYANDEDDGKDFVVSDGKYFIDGQEVNEKEFVQQYDTAKANSKDDNENEIHESFIKRKQPQKGVK